MAPVVQSLFTQSPLPAFERRGEPFLLAERIQNNITLSLFWNPDGTVSGKANGVEVPLKGIRAILDPSHLPNALKTLSEAKLYWRGGAIGLGGLVGGAPTAEAHELRAVAPSPGWGIPQRNQVFVGRESLLTDMRRRLTESGQASISQVATAGMGGVGKSALVIEYLHRNRRTTPPLGGSRAKTLTVVTGT